MVLDVVRVEKGRWQDDHILIIGHLATLKGDQMKNRNVQIPYELFFQLLQYFLMENSGRRNHKERVRKEIECNGRIGSYTASTKQPQQRKREKSPGRNTWKGREYRKLSLVEILSDYFITGACHAPVDINRGKE